MQDCLDLALLAPNSSNLQAWEFFWVKESRKRSLSKACLSQPAARTAAELVVAVAKTNTWKDHSKKCWNILTKAQPRLQGQRYTTTRKSLSLPIIKAIWHLWNI